MLFNYHHKQTKKLTLVNFQKWKKQGLTWLAGQKAGDVFGHSYPNKILKKLAEECGYDNPTRNTAHGKRKLGISAMINSKEAIPSKIVRNYSRHATDSINMVYQKPDESGMDKAIRALTGMSDDDKENFARPVDSPIPKKKIHRI